MDLYEAPLIELAVISNFPFAVLPNRVTAAMETTAISATRRIYSTSDSPSSFRTSITAHRQQSFTI